MTKVEAVGLVVDHRDDHDSAAAAMEAVSDPVVAAATGREAEFAEHGWDTAEVDPWTFLRSKLNWGELDEPAHVRLVSCYRKLLALRREHASLSDPWLTHVSVDYDEAARWIVVHRGTLALVCNLGEDHAAVPIAGIPLLSWEPPTVGRSATTVPGHSFTLLATAPPAER
ncbi:DUF3459 domain-containing protein [Nocardia sp. NPDC049220]|uniref:DUF3459 domain-containing protein n=1 Tax=Nocardia sp. NPDC049220 TaxID=3155273 RepID=UPI00340F4AB9